MKDLAGQKFPPAMFALGMLYANGDFFDRDPSQAVALISRAADKNYAPAMYQLGAMYFEGKEVPQDREKGLHLMRDAAVLGNTEAQFSLGNRYETGEGAPRDFDQARRYFGLCAAAGKPACQYKLATVLFELPNRHEREYVQGIAWLLLAAESLPQARQAMDAELPKISPAQMASAQRLKTHLVHGQ